MTRPARRTGFVLVMTLAVLALAGFLLAGMARQSLQRAMGAIEAEQELQRRWGTISCRQALLGQAAEIFDPSGASRESAAALDPLTGVPSNADVPPPIADAYLAMTVELSGMAFELVLADEDAKANLGTAYSLTSRPAVMQLVHDLSGTHSGVDIALRPNRILSPQPGTAVFDSWGQVFAADFLRRNDALRELQAATARMTCWGSGKLNVHRASPEAIIGMCGLVVGSAAANQLVSLRDQNSTQSASQLLQQLSLREGQLSSLQEILVDGSTCFSLWITIASRQRDWYELHIAEARRDEQREEGQAPPANGESTVVEMRSVASFVW